MRTDYGSFSHTPEETGDAKPDKTGAVETNQETSDQTNEETKVAETESQDTDTQLSKEETVKSDLPDFVRVNQRLNLRSGPVKNPVNVKRVLDEGELLIVHQDFDDEEWYSVETEQDGVVGFVMKKFVTEES